MDGSSGGTQSCQKGPKISTQKLEPEPKEGGWYTDEKEKAVKKTRRLRENITSEFYGWNQKKKKSTKYIFMLHTMSEYTVFFTYSKK